MFVLRPFFAASVACLAALSLAQSLKVEKFVLPNGLTVVLHEDHKLPVATINIWYRVGSKDEPPQRSGFAHLFEHLMFMGTKRVPNGQFDRIMEKEGGANNANTTEDRTDYFSEGPANLLPTLLWLDADRMVGIGKDVDQKKLDLQRDVVKNERRERVENTPYGKAYEAINGLMFPKGHPYHTSVIGSMEDLDRATVKDVQDFFSTFYTPNNAVLAVVGDFDSKSIRSDIERLFGAVPRSSDAAHATRQPVTLSETQKLTMVDKVQSKKVVLVWHAPAQYTAGFADLNLASAVLSDGLSSRLYQRLIVKDKLASEAGAFLDGRQLGSLFYVDLTLTDGANVDAAIKAVDETIKELAAKGPSKEELERQINKIKLSQLNNLQTVSGKATQLAESEALLGDPNGFEKVIESYNKVTTASIAKVIRTVIVDAHRLEMTIVPEVAATDESILDSKPAVAASKPFTFTSATEFKLSNGIKVEYWNRPELPLVSTILSLNHGGFDEADSKLGATSLMASMLDEGAGSRDGQQFEKALDLLGARFGASSSATGVSVSLSGLASSFGRGLDLFADAVLRPRFEKDAFERVQRVTAEGLQQSLDEPGTLAALIGSKAFFGENHPLGRPNAGSTTTVKGLQIADLKDRYAKIVKPENATLYIAGSLSEAQVKTELERVFGGWKSTGKTDELPKFANPEPTVQRVVILDRPGAVQTTIRIYMPGQKFDSADRLKLTELGTILGGTFTSRLNQNLREDKGYCYGAGGRFVFQKDLGYFLASSDVRADVTGASLKEFLAEFSRISKGDVSDEEAQKAGTTIRQNQISSLGSIDGLLQVAVGNNFTGSSFDLMGKDLSTLSAITSAELNSLAKSAFPVEKALIVLVGDRAEIEKQIAGLGLAMPIIVKNP